MSIDRNRKAVTSGTRKSVSQGFFNNLNVDVNSATVPPFSFYMPDYVTYGGTSDYYSQDPNSIFTNLISPPVRFIFTSHTESLSGKSYFIHDIFRLDYDIHKLYSDNQITNSTTLSNKTNKDNKVDSALSSPTTSTGSKILENINKLNLGNNSSPQPIKFFGEPLTDTDRATIQKYLSTPLYTITASTTGITSMVYDLPLTQYIKKAGSFKTELFQDKAQYFIKSRLAFYIDVVREYSDFQTIDSNAMSAWTDEIKVVTEHSAHTIQYGYYSGITVAGNFFTYFIVPDKPRLEYPILSGQLTTFTPEFRWSNGDRADSFMVQITYDNINTGFTGSVFNYPVEKSDKNAQTITNVINDTNSQLSTDKTIYTTQIPIRSNSDFLYRVGNSKEIIDAFNVRRNVITFSDTYSARTQIESIKTYVVVEADSGSIDSVAGFVRPPSLDYEGPLSLYSLSGTVSGSTSYITGGTAYLVSPNNNSLMATISTGGTYSFTNLTNGTYMLSILYGGFSINNQAIIINSDTISNIQLNLTWGNDINTWGEYYNNIF